ncbi:6-bladed beta-propeller [Algoriphagus mannitolivorans]|uniref:6-bladed beta-propeller n=1 Tax=Algoriphagus mannitolivorans TaxID=226504 RepID=UPI00040840A6|nr:6-bladed beta-propeller [Algoriphagus mannitolivorans]
MQLIIIEWRENLAIQGEVFFMFVAHFQILGVVLKHKQYAMDMVVALSNLRRALPFFLFWFCIGCAKKKIEDSTTAISVPIDLNKSENGNLSDAYQSIAYLLLENPDTLPLIRPMKVIMREELIGIEDRGGEKYVFYDQHGKQRFSLSASGDGPGEFIRTEDFQILGESILIKDPYLNKILTFDLNGVFKKEEKLPSNQGNFYRTNSSTLFYSKNGFDLGAYYFFRFKDNTFTGILEADKRLEGKVYSGKDGFVLNPFTKEIIFTIPFETTSVIFSKDGENIQKINFDFGGDQASMEDFHRLNPQQFDERVKNEGLVSEISSFYPLEDGYFLRVFRGEKEFHEIFLDKEFVPTAQFNKYKNDLDYMPIRNLPWFFSENKIGYMIPSFLFLEDYEKKFLNNSEVEKKGNIHQFVEENKSELKKDSYVLVFLEVKNSVFRK